jgi:glycosyltransferase involved in cell wall biosynthesis
MEGLGTSQLDAMCYARPIVATAAGGIPDAVEDGLTGRLVPPGDARALADALAAVLGDAALRARMGEAGRRRFLERFTDERMVDQTLAVYAEVA